MIFTGTTDRTTQGRTEGGVNLEQVRVFGMENDKRYLVLLKPVSLLCINMDRRKKVITHWDVLLSDPRFPTINDAHSPCISS